MILEPRFRTVNVSLPADLRDELRVAVNKARREQINWDRDRRCAGCGTESNNVTDGCKSCYNRRCARRRDARKLAAQSA
jgi:hypothetical protein